MATTHQKHLMLINNVEHVDSKNLKDVSNLKLAKFNLKRVKHRHNANYYKATRQNRRAH